jgi:hypothetical protein
MLRRLALVRTDVSEEPSGSMKVTRIGQLGTLAILCISSQRASVASYGNLMMEALSSSEASVLARTIRRNIPEDASLRHTHFLAVVNRLHVSLHNWRYTELRLL